ncbi:hypothetical protein V7266_21940 [Neobacillus drentensis]|uniref:hypothetical protein n=1 Tax=Neobacillus drentensis TaxID=220684 RepID=UPI002FFFDD45
MDKQNKFSTSMNDMGEPSEMSPINESEAPMVEVNQPTETQDPLEIRDSASVTII